MENLVCIGFSGVFCRNRHNVVNDQPPRYFDFGLDFVFRGDVDEVFVVRAAVLDRLRTGTWAFV